MLGFVFQIWFYVMAFYSGHKNLSTEVNQQVYNQFVSDTGWNNIFFFTDHYIINLTIASPKPMLGALYRTEVFDFLPSFKLCCCINGFGTLLADCYPPPPELGRFILSLFTTNSLPSRSVKPVLHYTILNWNRCILMVF